MHGCKGRKSIIHFFLLFIQIILSTVLSARDIAGNKIDKFSIHVGLTSKGVNRGNKLVNKSRCNTPRW